MKKTSFLLPIAMLSMLIVATPASHAYAAKVYKQTATVYQIKKTGKTYKITSQAKKTTDQDINVGKSVVIKGHRYYYSHVFKGYITDKAFALNAKLDEKRAKYTTSPFATDKNKNKNTNSNTNSNSSSNNVQNGYDNDTDTIVNTNEYQRVYLQTMLNEINNYRTSNGLNPLTLDATLTTIAQTRAQQNYNHRNDAWFDGHDDQSGNAYVTALLTQAGVTTTSMGENGSNGGQIAGMDGIMENPVDAAKSQVNAHIIEGPTGGHYQNMMDPTFTKIGLGVYTGPNNGQQTRGGVDEVYTN